MAAAGRIERLARRADVLMVPRPVPDKPGLLTVDATWGTISPIQIDPGVRTVGELEVIDHIDGSLPLVDTRLAHFYLEGSIPTARNIPHEQIEQSIYSLDPSLTTIFFCNGPQCAATPAVITHAPDKRLSARVDPLLPWGHPRLDDAGTPD